MGYRTPGRAPGSFPQPPPPGARSFFGLGDDDPGPILIPGIPGLVSAPRPNVATFRRVQIPAGSRGTTATLRIMAELAMEAASDPYFISWARSIVRGNGSKNYDRDADSILQFVKECVDYRPDPINQDIDYVQSPGWTLFVDEMGDCDDMSSLIAGLDLAAGLGAAFRAVPLDFQNPGVFSHVYPLVGIRDERGLRWLAQDAVPAVAQLGWQPPESEWAGASNDLIVAGP